MGVGFAGADPTSLLNAFTAWESNKVTNDINTSKHVNEVLDKHAASAASAAGQLKMYQIGARGASAAKLKGLDAATMTAEQRDQVYASLTPEERDAVEEDISDDPAILEAVTQQLNSNPLMQDEFKRAAGPNREFRRVEQYKDKDGRTGVRVVVYNSKTKTEGYLDSTEEGVKTAENPSVPQVTMSNRQFVANAMNLATAAAMRRGVNTADALGEATSQLSAVNNQAANEQAAAVNAAVDASAEAQARNARESSTTVTRVVNPLFSLTAGMGADGGGGGVAVAGLNGGAPQPQTTAPTPPVTAPAPGAPAAPGAQAPAPTTGTAAPKASDSPLVTEPLFQRAVKGTVQSFKGLASATADNLGGRVDEVRALARKQENEQKQRYIEDNKKYARQLAGRLERGGDKLNTRELDLLAAGGHETGGTQSVYRPGKDSRLTNEEMRAAGLSNEIIALVNQRRVELDAADDKKPTTGEPTVDRQFARGQTQYDELLTNPGIVAAAKGQGITPAQLLAKPAEMWQTFVDRKNFKAGDIAAVQKAAVEAMRAGKQLKSLTPNQQAAVGFMLQTGAMKPEDIPGYTGGRGGNKAAPSVGEGGAAMLAKAGEDSVDPSAVTVNTNTSMAGAGDRAVADSMRARADLMKAAKEKEDKFLEQLIASTKAFARDDEEATKLRTLAMGSLDEIKRRGIDIAQDDKGAALIGYLAKMAHDRESGRVNNSGFLGFFKDKYELQNINGVLKVALPLTLKRGSREQAAQFAQFKASVAAKAQQDPRYGQLDENQLYNMYVTAETNRLANEMAAYAEATGQ